MESIKNYYLITDNIATSGQPTTDQFTEIAQAGYKIVINLALPSSDNALPDEGAIVTQLGMIYLHIPVIWDSPKIEDLQFFCEVMESTKKHKVWVHCALNMRVSCFMYLYRKLILKLPEIQAQYPMTELWQPNKIWQQFIQEAEANLITFC
ncbi:phosphatase [Aphanothece hegewaldii CCALA 016]|uniref:Phosphatase n=1 Tax=Aphanothece hegewaldii CCALA 016 TaxID=2107694 RepID=A0A2T1LTW2_9CHRO|nr:protein tyrosine phosphatase family protein [Aphanothece hegewaldii]PSF34556.1 phosphatase [Aphanothece hegewaldii CCALA 016]